MGTRGTEGTNPSKIVLCGVSANSVIASAPQVTGSIKDDSTEKPNRQDSVIISSIEMKPQFFVPPQTADDLQSDFSF